MPTSTTSKILRKSHSSVSYYGRPNDFSMHQPHRTTVLQPTSTSQRCLTTKGCIPLYILVSTSVVHCLSYYDSSQDCQNVQSSRMGSSSPSADTLTPSPRYTEQDIGDWSTRVNGASDIIIETNGRYQKVPQLENHSRMPLKRGTVMHPRVASSNNGTKLCVDNARAWRTT